MRRIISVCAVSVIVLTAFLVFYVPGEGCQGGCINPCNGCYLTATAEAGGSQEPSGNARAAAAGADALMQEATPGPEETPPFEGEGPCLLGYDFPELVTLLGRAEMDLDPQTDRPLCLIDIVLPPEEDSNSYMSQGETDTFYVCEGEITFKVNDHPMWSLDKGVVRVVPGPLDSAGELLEAGLDDQLDGSYQTRPGTSPTFTLSAGSSIYLDFQETDAALSYTNMGSEENAALLISSAPPAGAEGVEVTHEAEPIATPEC
jgi:hypothetical protein